MSATTAEQTATPTRIRSTRRASLVIGLVGIIGIPLGLSLTFNSWDVPDAEDYVRMAFATVAGQTIALVTSWALLIAALVRRARRMFPVLVVVTAVVTSGAISAFDQTAENVLRMVGS